MGIFYAFISGGHYKVEARSRKEALSLVKQNFPDKYLENLLNTTQWLEFVKNKHFFLKDYIRVMQYKGTIKRG